MKYVAWSFLVWVPAMLLVSLAAASGSCENPNGCFGPSGGDIAAAVFVVALPIYLLGLLVMWWLDRTSGPPKTQVRSGPPGRKQGW